nr:ABC transporter ATP-binding protein [Desulfobulbaceae bacterium]
MQQSYGFFEEDKLGNVKDVHLWKRILVYVAPQKKGVFLAIVLSAAVICSSLALPYLIRTAIDSFILATELNREQRMQGLQTLIVIFSGVVFLGFVANFYQVTVLERTGQNIMHRMRQHLFAHMVSMDLSYFNSNPTGKLVTRLTNDIQNMHEMFTSVIITIFNDTIQLVAILVILFFMNWKLALVMSLLIPVVTVSSILFSKKARDAFRNIRTKIAAINSFLQESISGASLIQLFRREQDCLTKFHIENDAYTRKTLYQIKIFGMFLPFIEVVSTVSIALIIWYGGGQILENQMTLGVLAAFLSYMRLFFKPVREISQKFSIVQSALASAERIFELLDKKSSFKVNENVVIPRVEGAINFRDVNFSYNNQEMVLKNFNLTIQQGDSVAIVGPTGSGKTTIINLLERLYDIDSGSITIDGVDLSTIDLNWLRNQIGLVMQDIFLIPGSFRDNICFGQQLSEPQLQEIINKSQLQEVVKRLPDGIETKIGEGGYELSAGQKQLLAMARVLARDPKIMILDEATASIDSETEMLLEKAISETMKGRTSIFIAHRLSTIRHVAKVIVLKGGESLESGSYADLLGKKGMFYKMVSQQKINFDAAPHA